MTNGKAIITLNSLKRYYNDKNEDGYVGFDSEDNEALNIAIQALEQQPLHGYKIDMFTPTAQAWLSTFNTDSATECFTAVQELKEKVGKEN